MRAASPNSRRTTGGSAQAARPAPAPVRAATWHPTKRERRQRVKVPWALVASGFYSDVALAVYIKVKALGQRPEGCTAGTVTLASYMGMSTSSVERGLAQLRSPRPDGVIELPENTRRSLPGGTGTTACRRVRRMSSTELYVWLPVAASEDLTPRQLRAYTVLMFAQAQGIPLTLRELAGYLRHFSGRRAGQPISATAAAAVVDGLAGLGWASVHRRAGDQGRNVYVAHDMPQPMAPDGSEADGYESSNAAVEETTAGGPATPSTDLRTPVVGEGSGSPVRGGSLATKEDQRIARPEDEPRLSSPAVGETRVDARVELARIRREPRAANPAAGLALRADADTSPPPKQSARPSTGGGVGKPYTGPQLTLSPRIYAVLEPVHWLLQQVDSPFLVRQIAREVGRQLRGGTDAARLHHRLTVRFAGTSPSEIRDPGRWLLGVALPRWGCGHLDCEAGTMWSTGAACAVCAEVVADRRAARRRQSGQLGPYDTGAAAAPRRPSDGAAVVPDPPQPPAPPRADCGECGCRIVLTGKARTDGLCKPCREQHAQVGGETEAEGARPSAVCAGWDGLPCDRPALPTRTVCARHRAREVAGEREAS
ncbi:hypothetical protein [Streptomyces sp. NPDC050485]|uniref:hypothetical protein n=1 Tax=Streptomyces sp. NPDC050485 TaxID=3365617 RepID=UPI0037AACE12